MRMNKKMLFLALPLAAGLLIGILMAQPQDNGIDYEVTPDINIAPRRSDVVEIVSAYERLMDRYMVLVERNMFEVSDQVGANTQTIDNMNERLGEVAAQLDTMNARLAAIADALEVELPGTGAVETIPLQQNQRQQAPQQQQLPARPQPQSRRIQQMKYSY